MINDCDNQILSRFKTVGLLSQQNRNYINKQFNSDAHYNSSNHKLAHILQGHSGCINSLHWSKEGRFLVSGSDDLHINVHRYIPGKDPELVCKIETRHYNNIFDAKFNPHFEDKLVSAAADGRICIIDNWERGRHDENIRSIRVSSTDSAKTIEFIDANNFLVGCEDGRILQFDLRDPNPAAKIRCNFEEDQISIHSLSKCESAPHLLAVAGDESFVRIFDIRSNFSKSAYSWCPPLRLDGDKTSFPTGVRFSRFGTTLAINYIRDAAYLIDPVNQRSNSDTFQALCRHKAITAPKLERELIEWRKFNASYKAGRFAESETIMLDIVSRHQRHVDDENWVKIIYCELFNRVLCVSRLPILHTPAGQESVIAGLTMIHSAMDYWPARYLILMYFLSVGLIEACSRTCEAFLELAKRSPSNEWTEKIAQIASIVAVCELDPAQIPILIPKSFGDVCAQIPIIDLTTHPITLKILNDSPQVHGYLGRYPGALHERTFKGISFAGDSDQFIGIGSDGGYACLFSTRSTQANDKTPCWAARSDASVVNVVEAHPFLPCIAVSGIDSTIKMWQPDCLLPSGQHQSNSDYEAYQSDQIPNVIKNIPSSQGFNRLDDNIFNMDASFMFFGSFM